MGFQNRFGDLAFKSFPAENHAILLKGRYLQLFVQYFTGH